MRRRIEIKKGLNLAVEGGITDYTRIEAMPDRVAMMPGDFPGFTPKLAVREGDEVRCGQALMHDKDYTDIYLTSPASGVVEAVVRGARRKIERVVVKVDPAKEFLSTPPVVKTPEQLRLELMHSGFWAMMRRRPYSIVPRPSDVPRDIVVTSFDTSPLAPDFEKSVGDLIYYASQGVAAMKMLTPGHVYLCVDEHSTIPDIEGADIIEFNRLHPSGNPGFQLAQIAPINKGDVIWTMDIYLLAKIGELLSKGVVNSYVNCAIVGSEITHPHLVHTLMGANIEPLLKGYLKDDGKHKRIISGNILSGARVSIDSYLHYPYRQITVIPEGDDVEEFMGWAQPGKDKLSVNRSILGHFLPKKFTPDARLNGSKRAMIMSGEWDKYFPMDIMTEYLVKAILARDIDQMEALGIYEVAPEDFSLAEFADPSKMELQRIVRQGLDYMRKETE